MRNILYGRSPESLAEAFAIAQTAYYDDNYMHLDGGSGRHQSGRNENDNYRKSQ